MPFDGDLAFLHRLQQRGLGLGRSAVDLVGQQQPGEQGALTKHELGAVLVEQVGAGEVSRQQIGGELGAGELQTQRPGEAAGGQGLAEAGHVFEQHVAAGDDAGQHQGHLGTLAHQGLVHLVQHMADAFGGLSRG